MRFWFFDFTWIEEAVGMPFHILLWENLKRLQLLLIAICVLLSEVSLQAQTGETVSIPSLLQSAQILDSQEVDLGHRSILYNRIAPPELKPEPVFPDAGSEPVSPALWLRNWRRQGNGSLCGKSP